MIISSPMNESELRNLMYTAQLESTNLPFVIRYPRGEGVMPEWKTELKQVEIGKGRKIKDGKEVAIVSLGHPGNFVSAAIRELRAEGIDPAHYDLRFVKPIDEEMLHEVFQKYSKVITVEDGTVVGGMGSAVLEFMAAHQYQAEVHILGIPDRLVEHGTPKQLYAEIGIDPAGIVNTVKKILAKQATAVPH
jgi:1-deoxy-D-xylulose-5-phosphate synthase